MKILLPKGIKMEARVDRNRGKAATAICVLAHNEEKNIRATLLSIIDGTSEKDVVIKVYANGCTDGTHHVVGALAKDFPQIKLVEIDTASKSNAWNRAFTDNHCEILIFADGDVIVDGGATEKLLEFFAKNSELELACCRFLPLGGELSWQQRLTGFLQLPMRQDFLTGHFYGIRRDRFVSHFARLGVEGLPQGLVGDDVFLDSLVDRVHFGLLQTPVRYTAPSFEDYIKYLGRIRWQNEQVKLYFQSGTSSSESKKAKFIQKILGTGKISAFILGSFTTLLRVGFKMIFKKRIEREYKKLGPVTTDGSWVLSSATRSESVK